MGNYGPETPLVVATSAEEVQDALVPPPDSATNFADDEKTLEWLRLNLVPLIKTVRDDGAAQRDEWEAIRRMANLQKDENAAYSGRSNVYLPVYQRALETRVSHTGRGLFPSDTYLDAYSADPRLEQAAPVVKAWMEYQLERSAKLRATMKPWLRQLFNYGLSVGKVWWEKPLNERKQTRMMRLPAIQDMLMNYGEVEPWTCEGARFKARSIFSWFIWPTTVDNIEEASLVFEDIQVSKQRIDYLGQVGAWKNVEEALNALRGGDEDTDYRLAMQMEQVRSSTQTAANVRLGELAHWGYATECWFRMPVPNALYRQNEVKGSAVPVKVVLVGNVVVEARRNPFWHQSPPYVFSRLNEQPDSFYSIGMGRAAAGLQYLANDFINQTNDNGIYALNPIVKINPNLIVGPIEPLAPGRMWHLTDPNGAVFDRPPIEQMQYGLMIANQMISYANDMSGAPSVLQGTGTKGTAKTATGAQILQSNVKGDLQDIIEDIELRVLVPLMEMIHSLGQQYERAQRYMAIAGGEKVQFSRNMLEGEFAWRWVASSQAVNRAMRAQSSMQFAQLAAGMMPLLQAQGKMFNPEPLLRSIYEDGLGQRGFDRIIQPMPQQPMAPSGPGMPPGGPQGGPGMPPGMGPQEPRSAVEQAPGGAPEGMAPGEGEAFGEVRGNADQLAAMMGQMGGMGGNE